MKNVLMLTAGLALASSAFITQASESDNDYISPSLEAKLVKICEAVMSDKRLRLHLSLKANRLSVRDINRGLKCNGESPYNFAMTHEAYTNADFLNRGRVEIRDIAYQPVSVTVAD
ncbi:hypothetical protein HMF8227_00390 [Saliniradius amylolyticus]|uniref:DUF3718 domain-containing protein n=1 Tax=Saliniradius amylolyticus TaxID=2183582 RepID=A0A2S2DZU2_9ALTE|nr:DUF3718 domain-containing protein [Saliniradius amylolyticus]AWL10896.1 hypothetical protein HMF8227_00390 [Saliniradius amylolyticus]